MNSRPMNGYSINIANKVKISMAFYTEQKKGKKGWTGFHPRHFYGRLCFGELHRTEVCGFDQASESRISSGKRYTASVVKG